MSKGGSPPLKKRVAGLILLLCLLLTAPVSAANDPSPVFSRTKTYTNQFSDLSPDSVFYNNVSALFEYGLSVGKIDGTYGLTDSLTVGQAVIFAGRIRSLYRTGDAEAGPANHKAPDQATAQPYLLYLQSEGILGSELDGQLPNIATRAQMAHILANLLPEEILPPIHEDLVSSCYSSRRFLKDVTEETPYRQDILSLYKRGVCIGSDAAGSFHPDAPISRGAVAAMLTRMMDPALRVTPQWDLSAARSAKGTSLANLVTPGTYVAAPSTAAEMDESIRYMLSSDSNTLSLSYPSMTMTQAHNILMQALSAVKMYPEQGYNYASCDFTSSGTMSLTFSSNTANLPVNYRQATMDAAIAIHDKLWNNGTLREDMTQWEIAHAYYTWLCENCTYDFTADDFSPSHLPYGVFLLGTAVCDGYTGAYNLLLKLEGIPCSTYTLNDHIWTTAILDGTEYHIDTTWGDSSNSVNYMYFAMTPELSLLYHR